ncbi:hypothetical protein COY28_00315 [Candidatus Woesearchaeota archaeon CG_4_10_14_0_2_um_filter_57_5]|nr:MAG: hypothetical protein COY28_00315 [Candidatus Woesearchaeota archaeon CG_4_10_14_0_2_um_filter_57_5]
MISTLIPLFRTVIAVMVLYAIFQTLLGIFTRRMLARAKTKHHVTNVQLFARVARYGFFLILLLVATFTYSGSWLGFGLTAGLVSAALGWALQKPITGIAAWAMVVTKRPFEIGDRVIIGTVQGDVEDITLSHIQVAEFGGTIQGEEKSGRTILIPTSTLFDQNIINYTSKDDYVKDEVVVSVTYESNLDKALALCVGAAKKHCHGEQKPYTRCKFAGSSVDVYIRYNVLAKKRQEVSSAITKEIFDVFRKNKKTVEIAYPHTEVVFRKKR